jgi:hypothetical protein
LGSQSYHALQVTLNKRRSHGVTAYASYTYSRSRGNVATGFQETWSVGPIQDVHNLGMEANVISRFDQTNVLKGYVAWELPFGKGKRFANKEGLTDALLGGWEVSLIFRYDTGAPIGFNSNGYIAGWSDFGYPIYVNRNANVGLGNNFDPTSSTWPTRRRPRTATSTRRRSRTRPTASSARVPAGSRSCGGRAALTRTSAS